MKRSGLRLFALLSPALLWAAGAAAAGGSFVEPANGMEFVQVKGGTYLMGDFSGQGIPFERPAHTVTVSDFHLARHEVTVAQFRAFVAATGYRTDCERAGAVLDIDPVMKSMVRRVGVSWHRPGRRQQDRSPVSWVSWNDANEYARWLAQQTGKPYRLPTEAEWEFAARERGGDLPWAGTADPARAAEFAWTAENSGGESHAVGEKAPNALGLHDLSGNVWEWCLDWQEAYGTLPAADPAGPAEGRFRALRGGSWRVTRELARTTYRNGYKPDYAHETIGFRIALPADVRI